VVVTGDAIPDSIFHYAGVVSVLPGRVSIRVAAEHSILMAFGHERLVREDESVVRGAGQDIELLTDPRLLLLDGVTVGVTIRVNGAGGEGGTLGVAVLRSPRVEHEETRAVASAAIIEGIAHSVEVRADVGRAVEVEGIPCGPQAARL